MCILFIKHNSNNTILHTLNLDDLTTDTCVIKALAQNRTSNEFPYVQSHKMPLKIKIYYLNINSRKCLKSLISATLSACVLSVSCVYVYSIRVPGWVLKCLNLITAPGSVSNQPGSVTWLATAGISKIHAVSWRNHIENQTTKGAQNM